MGDPKVRWWERHRQAAFLPHPGSKCAEDRQPSDRPAENSTLTFPCGRERKGKESPQVQAVSRISQLVMETLSPGPVAHNLSCTYPEVRGWGWGRGSWPLPKRGTGVSSQGHRQNLASRAVHATVYPWSRPLPWEAPPRHLVDGRGRPRREEQERGQNLFLGLVRLVARVWGCRRLCTFCAFLGKVMRTVVACYPG